MRVLVKIILSIVLFIIYGLIWGAMTEGERSMGYSTRTPGVSGMILFLVFVGAMIGVWKYKPKKKLEIEKQDGDGDSDDIKNVSKF